MGLQDAANTMVAGGAVLPTLASFFGSSTNNHAGRDQRQATSAAIRASIVDKVKYAKEAGVSPLYALGAPVMSASSAVGSPAPGGNELADNLRSMGAGIDRAIQSQGTSLQRDLLQSQIDGSNLDNDIKRAQLASMTGRLSQSLPPVMPIVGEPGISPDGSSSRAGARPGVTMMPDGNTVVVDTAVTPNQVSENEYGDWWSNMLGMAHGGTDVIRALNNWAQSKLGPMPDWADPWKMGGAAGRWLNNLPGGRPYGGRKKYYDRVAPEFGPWW